MLLYIYKALNIQNYGYIHRPMNEIEENIMLHKIDLCHINKFKK